MGNSVAVRARWNSAPCVVGGQTVVIYKWHKANQRWDVIQSIRP